MSPAVFTAVLVAAAMHAVWNAMVKVQLDRFASITLMSSGMGTMALILSPFVDFPHWGVWPFIFASAAFQQGYKLCLIKAYAAGDLAQVYPLARGSAPLLTTIGAMVLINEYPGSWAVFGIGLLCAGTILMSLRGGGLQKLNREALAYAFSTSFFIACYTLADGNGVRLASSAYSYAVWLFITDGTISFLLAMCLRGPVILPVMARSWKIGLAVGALSAASYGIAMWAMTLAPIGAVAALRESSILFAMIISVVVLREGLGPWRLVAGILIVGGVMALRLA
ncbi:EamA family transporter [Tianweitania sp. BSSL-BM11]|uniref:EamA family transporter n=1 Tax=Tianweitania aestuarii TaxID=2814886 RepID=A0ABS5S1P2_9HYPH|nr:EamA family transporter [Tianweitania aestuarii]MBS9722446.1 EamA family transporter [Tianweitania aestuarii]